MHSLRPLGHAPPPPPLLREIQEQLDIPEDTFDERITYGRLRKIYRDGGPSIDRAMRRRASLRSDSTLRDAAGEQLRAARTSHRTSISSVCHSTCIQARAGTLAEQVVTPTDMVPLLVNVCMYTEKGYTLQRTIEALALQQSDWKAVDQENRMHVWLIVDGWNTQRKVKRARNDEGAILAATMKQTLPEGVHIRKDLARAYDNALDQTEEYVTVSQPVMDRSAVDVLAPIFNLHPLELRRDLDRLFADDDTGYALLQNLDDTDTLRPVEVNCGDANASEARKGAPQPAPEMVDLYFSVIIKKANAKKYNSHQIFFETLRPLYGNNLEYCFCTDVGTLYAPNMICNLARYIEENPDCAACCAHQRIMSYVDQAPPETDSAEAPFAAFLRNIQQYDFEAGLAVFNGMHAFLGFLPVLPGPCAFFRADSISKELLDDQKAIVTRPAYEDGIVDGNLKIAEDRIPSYLLLLEKSPLTGASQETHWVPHATFFFESEDSLAEFIPQRRRWLNGTVAGYLWLLHLPPLLDKVVQCNFMAIKIMSLSVIQLLIFGMLYTMPALFVITGHLAISGLCAFSTACGIEISMTLLRTFVGLFWSTYIVSFLLLTGYGRWGTKPVVEWVWWIRIIINAFIMLINTLVLVLILVLTLLGKNPVATEDLGSDLYIAATGAALLVGTPFLLTLMHSWGSFRAMLTSFPAFYVFLPTMLVDLFAYSVSKLDDWSWGTKGAASASTTKTSQARVVRSTRARLSIQTSMIFLGQNIILWTLSVTYLVLENEFPRFLVLQGLIPGLLSLGVMAGSFWYYATRAAKTLISLNREVTLLERVDSVVRIMVYCLWLFCVAVWGIYVVNAYVVETSVGVQGFHDPFMVIGLLAALVVTFACLRFSIELCGNRKPVRDDGRLTRGRHHTCYAFVITLFCIPAALLGLTVTLLTVCNTGYLLARRSYRACVVCCCTRADGKTRPYNKIGSPRLKGAEVTSYSATDPPHEPLFIST